MNRCVKYVFLFIVVIFSAFLFVTNNHDIRKTVEHENVVSVKFLDYANRKFVDEFFVTLQEELSYSNKTFTKNVPICYGNCFIADKTEPTKELYFSLKFETTECTSPYVLLEDENSWRLGEAKAKLKGAYHSFPCYLNLELSKIPKANRGVFTKTTIPKGIIFGPYKGLNRKLEGEEGEEAKNGGFAWKIEDDEKSFFVDGADEFSSNWMRYVNSARFLEEQNLYPVQMDRGIYYFVFNTIPVGRELLVWYGAAYAKNMGIAFHGNLDQEDKAFAMAPPRNQITCPSCDQEIAI